MQGKDEHLLCEWNFIALQIRPRLRITNCETSYFFLHKTLQYTKRLLFLSLTRCCLLCSRIWLFFASSHTSPWVLVPHHSPCFIQHWLSTGHYESTEMQDSFQFAKQHSNCIWFLCLWNYCQCYKGSPQWAAHLSLPGRASWFIVEHRWYVPRMELNTLRDVSNTDVPFWRSWTCTLSMNEKIQTHSDLSLWCFQALPVLS